MRHRNWYDRSPMWPIFNHGCPKPCPPDAEPYNTPYAVLGYDELGAPVFTVHTVEGETYEVPVENDIIVLKDTTYELLVSDDKTSFILRDSYGKETSISVVATADSPGMMSGTDKTKLDGIEEGAQKNTITGVKGDAENSYRTGNVSISKDDIGLGNVENLSPSELFTSERISAGLGYTPANVRKVASGDITLNQGTSQTLTFSAEQLGVTDVLNSNIIVQVVGTGEPWSVFHVGHGESVAENTLFVYIWNMDEQYTFGAHYTIYVVD